MMNIEIRQPRIEALIQQRMASGHFTNVEDAILHALECAPAPLAHNVSQPGNAGPASRVPGFGRNLVEVMARAREFAGDLDLSRDGSTERPIDLT